VGFLKGVDDGRKIRGGALNAGTQETRKKATEASLARFPGFPRCSTSGEPTILPLSTRVAFSRDIGHFEFPWRLGAFAPLR